MAKKTFTDRVMAYEEEYRQTLKDLGTYRPELDQAIHDLSANCALRDLNEEAWAEDGFRMTDSFENKNGTVNTVKSQYLQNHQQLDDKILKWKKEMGLTAYSMSRLGTLEKEDVDELDALSG